MSKTGKKIIASARQALAYARGDEAEGFIVHVPEEIDVRAIRKHLDLTREQFAQRYGFAESAIKEWEIGRRAPDRAARVLLRVIEREPEAVSRALAKA